MQPRQVSSHHRTRIHLPWGEFRGPTQHDVVVFGAWEETGQNPLRNWEDLRV